MFVQAKQLTTKFYISLANSKEEDAKMSESSVGADIRTRAGTSTFTNYQNFTLLSAHNGGGVMSFKEFFRPVEFKIFANRQDLNLKIPDVHTMR